MDVNHHLGDTKRSKHYTINATTHQIICKWAFMSWAAMVDCILWSQKTKRVIVAQKATGVAFNTCLSWHFVKNSTNRQQEPARLHSQMTLPCRISQLLFTLPSFNRTSNHLLPKCPVHRKLPTDQNNRLVPSNHLRFAFQRCGWRTNASWVAS